MGERVQLIDLTGTANQPGVWRRLAQRALLAVANRVASLLPPTRGFGLRRALYNLAGLELERNPTQFVYKIAMLGHTKRA